MDQEIKVVVENSNPLQVNEALLKKQIATKGAIKILSTRMTVNSNINIDTFIETYPRVFDAIMKKLD